MERWKSFAWITITGFALFYRSLFYDFSFDDYRLIVINYSYLGDIRNIFLAFTKSPYWQNITPFYRPILTLSFMMDALLGGVKPFVYHLTNIIIHISACCTLLVLLMKLGYGKKRPFILAILFCIHPVLVQAVAWIPGRNDSLAALYAMGSMIFLLEYLKYKQVAHFIAHLLILLLAIFTKETVIILPVVFFLYLLLSDQGKKPFKEILPLYSAWTASTVLYIGARLWFVGQGEVKINTFPQNAVGFVSYIGKIFFPINLSVLPIPENMQMFTGVVAIGLVFIVAIGLKVSNIKMFIFGAAWFTIFLLPTAIRITDFAVFYEHRLYLPMVGICFMLMELGRPRNRTSELALKGLLAISITAFSFISIRHSSVFKDSLSFWGNGVSTSPDSYFAHFMMGNNYLGRNMAVRAEQEYAASIRLNPRYVNSYGKMSELSLIRGDSAGAEGYLLKAISIDTLNPLPYNAHGVYLLKKNDYSGAELQFKRAKRLIGPKTPLESQSVILYNLGLIDMDRVRLDEALNKFKEASQLDPLDARSLFQIGVIKYHQGSWKGAVTFLIQSIALDSTCGEAYDYLGMARLNQGDLPGALKGFVKARSLMPQNSLILEHIAFAFYIGMDYQKAISYYDSSIVLGLKPDPEVLSILKKYRKTRGAN